MAAPTLPNGQPWPGVSVIIPAYNYAHYLPLTLDSVFRQNYPALELIVVDDGSTDATAEVVKTYGDRIRYVHQTNAGLSAARNTGIRTATCDYLCFLDADDTLNLGMLHEAIRTFVSLPDEFAVVAFPAQPVDPVGKLLPVKQLLPLRGREITGREIILKSRFPTGGVVKRAVFAECGFYDTSLRSSEDRDIWIRISARRKIYLHQERMIFYRRHPNSMSRNTARMKANMARVIRKARHDQRVSRREIFYWLRVWSFYQFQGAWMYWDEKRRWPAVRDMLVSLLLWPWFPDHNELNEPTLFRLRALAWFLRRH
ncbi:MAG: hypothetical protein RL380_334 [Verrucomicrobiota bacterium]